MRKYKIKDIMESKGMSINDVADKSQGLLTYTKITNQLSGRTIPNSEHIQGYINALELNNDEICSIFFETNASKMKR